MQYLAKPTLALLQNEQSFIAKWLNLDLLS